MIHSFGWHRNDPFLVNFAFLALALIFTITACFSLKVSPLINKYEASLVFKTFILIENELEISKIYIRLF